MTSVAQSPVEEQRSSRWVLWPLALAVVVPSLLYLGMEFSLSDGETCDGALFSVDDADVRTEVSEVSRYERPTIPGYTSEGVMYQYETIREPTSCSIAARDRYAAPAAAISLLAVVLAIDTERRAWRDLDDHPDRRTEWNKSRPRRLGVVVFWLTAGLWYGDGARLPVNALMFGSVALLLGVAFRNHLQVRRTWSAIWAYTKEHKIWSGRAQVMFWMAPASLWVGAGCLLALAAYSVW